MTKFMGHGSFEARLEGNVLIYKATGPWNLESLDENTPHEFIRLIRSLYGSRWGVVGDFYGEPVHVPAAAEKLIEIIAQEKQKGRVATGLVVKNSVMPALGKQHFSEIYTRACENFLFFDTVEEAVAWVDSKIKQSP